MHSDSHATAAAERTTCTSPHSDHAHVATDPTGSTNAVWTSSTNDGSKYPGRSKQRQWPCNYGVGHGDFSHYNLSSRIYSILMFLLHDQLVVRSSGSHLRTHWSITRKQDWCWRRPRCRWFGSWIPDACRLSSTIPPPRIDWSRCVAVEPSLTCLKGTS